MIKILVYTVLTIMGMYMGYIYAETPGLDAQTAWTLLVIYCAVLVIDVIEFKAFIRRREG